MLVLIMSEFFSNIVSNYKKKTNVKMVKNCGCYTCPQYLLSPSRSTCPWSSKVSLSPFLLSISSVYVFSKISSFYPPMRDSIPLFCDSFNSTRCFVIVSLFSLFRRMFLLRICIKICSLADMVKVGADFLLTRCLRKCIYMNYV